MENLDIKNFTGLTGVSLGDYILFVTSNGKDGKMKLSMLVGYMQNLTQPYIDTSTGTWKVRSEDGSAIDTGIQAEGKTPVLKKGDSSTSAVLWKYADEDDTAWRPLVEWSDVRLNVPDLTEEQLYKMKLNYSDLTEEDKEDLRSVFTDILKKCQDATDAANEVVQKTNEAANNAGSAATAANNAAESANEAADSANTAAKKVTDAITDISAEKEAAIEAAKNANDAADNANDKASLADGIYNTVKDWYDTITSDWDSWFAATKKTWNDWFAATKKEWTDWFSARKTEWTTLSKNVTDATTSANDAAKNANDKAALADTNAKYAKEQGDYAKKEGDYADEIATHPPYIGDDGYWYNYDYSQKKYVKTEIYAKGGATFLDFSINPETLECEVNVPPEDRDRFELAEDGQIYILTDN